MLVFLDQITILRVALFARPFINVDKLQTFPEENFMNTPFVSKRAPIYADVPDEKWNDWRWQLSHRLNSVEEIEKILPLNESERKALQTQRLVPRGYHTLFHLADRPERSG